MVYIKVMENILILTDIPRGEKENEEKTVCCSHLDADCMYAGTHSNCGRLSAKLDAR